MQPLPPNILMPPFKQFYPSFDSLDESQKVFYMYWKLEFENGTPREADTSYIFIYIYDLFDKYIKGINREENLLRIKQLKEVYSNQVGSHIAQWLSNVYLIEKKYEEAVLERETIGGVFNSDNLSLFLKLKTNRDISANDVIQISKKLGFVQSTTFNAHILEVYELIEVKIKTEFPDGGVLKSVISLPYISLINEYLGSGMVSKEVSLIKIPDVLSNSYLPEKCVAWTLEISDVIQQKYGRKNKSKKPNKQKQNIERALWEIRIKDAFKNPATLQIEQKCSHEYLRLDNHWMVYRKYNCIHCKEVFMCECDKEIALAIRPYQTEGKWLTGICPGCRGLDDVSLVTSGKLMYGSTFYAMRWREIAKEANRLAVENKDEPDRVQAENNIRLKYGVPLIGEGWISETTLYKNLQELFPKLEVIHHGKPKWLGRMHLDVYIPSLNIAFEYQGKQHYEVVEYFGGYEALERTKGRDSEKARLCKDNGITLFYIHEGEDFSLPTLKKLLRDFLIEFD